jgi:hypothetical protein
MSMVTLTELLPTIHKLNFSDKVRLIRILAEDLDVPKNQEPNYFETDKTYHLHTPQFETGAAAILMQALAEASKEN